VVTFRVTFIRGHDLTDEPAQPLDGQRRHTIAPSAQRDPNQAVGLGLSAAPPTLGQVDADLAGGGSVELPVDVGLNLRAQSKVTQMIHVSGTRRGPWVIPEPGWNTAAPQAGSCLRD
jgi:hypothetical protein